MSKQRLQVHADVSTIKSQLRKDEKYSQGIRLYVVYQIAQGRKRHIVTDTLGCLLLVLVHGAGVQDRNGIKQVLPLLKYKFLGSIKAIIADNGYSGQPVFTK
ncbi:hypothetical protein EZS27_005448 [termite gut metagenome]|uniref:Transposase IS4-like domain-containing protein n=1 Tax=termite gut metagenome TaxID=433724 RepID=A0A5J4SLT2_9ZZZZ